MDRRIKAVGARNAYFPLFIPKAHLEREAEHVEGFSPELAVVTIAGGKTLDEPIVVRPTSETIIGQYMAKWVQSHRDLPLLLNQWANVVRWELRPRLFLRTSEFLWQEGHTAHASAADASAYAARILYDVYADFMINVLAIPNFARAFDINYLTPSGQRHLAWTTSWGTSTRMVGGLIMVHGDDDGLRVPPILAPVQVVVIAVKAEVLAAAASVVADLQAVGIRAELDERVDVAFGRRAVDWELKGVPVRIELGPRDLAAGSAMCVSRVLGTKTPVPLGQLVVAVEKELKSCQDALLAQALAERDARTVDVATVGEAVEAMTVGWARIPTSKMGEDGERLLAESAVTVRCLQDAHGGVPASESQPDMYALLARAY